MNSNDFKQTLTVEVNVPEHEKRKRSSLFTRTRLQLIDREDRCFICGRTAQATGHPLEAHHHPVEWSLANLIDWQRLSRDCKAGLWGPHAAAFDWTAFFVGATTAPFDYVDEDSGHAISTSFLIPKDPYLFVDNMLVNGMLLCKDHHVENSEGIHAMPHPLWIAQKYAVTGYQFSKSGQIHHGDPTHE